MLTRRHLPLLLLLFSLASCQLSTQQPSPTPTWPLKPSLTPAFTQTLTPPIPAGEGTPQPASPSPTAAPPAGEPARTQYAIRVEYDHPAHSLQVSMTVLYVNTSSEAISELVFDIEPNRMDGAFKLTSLAWGEGRKVSSYTLQGAWLKVPLESPLLPGRTVSLLLQYELNLPDKAGLLGYTSRQTNLTNWYPFLPYYQAGKGFLMYEPAATGEAFAYDVADFWVDFHLVSPIPNLVIAASAPAEQDGDNYRYTHLAARNFALSLSDVYIVQTAIVGNVTIRQYLLPGSETPGEWSLFMAQDAVSLYSTLFAPYPRRELAIVEADYFDGMEYDGLYFLGKDYYTNWQGDAQGYLTALTVHEISHQWWVALVGNDQAVEPWLDEALATYTEALFYETYYPELVDWWWDYRIYNFNPSGYVNTTIYDWSSFRPYVNAVYLRGALFLKTVRSAVGDEAFFAFLKEYFNRYSYKMATAQDFFSLLSEFTSADLNALKTDFFR